MVGALPVMGSVLDSHTLCFKSDGGDLGFYRNAVVGRKQLHRSSGGQFRMRSSGFVGSRVTPRVVNRSRRKQQRKMNGFVVVCELAGQYEDSFEDVKAQVLNYFTYKAVKTVLSQLYEMNPTQYRWLYDFVVNNKPGDGKRFLRTLVKEKQDLAERVMVTRLHLYGKWIKKCDHAAMYQEISDENLELMRERLMETVIWPSDDTNTEKIG